MTVDRMEIGSDFEADSRFSNGAGLRLSGALLTFSGRQALGLIAQECVSLGIGTCVLPGHHCYSMAQPFLDAGMAVELCETTPELVLDAERLREIVRSSGGRKLILHSDTFGVVARADLVGALVDASSAGFPVVVDNTHSLLGISTKSPDYTAASLRKLLPVPDGGAVWGLSRIVDLAPTPGAAIRLKQSAAEQKRLYLNGVLQEKVHLETFAAAERSFRSTWPPQRASVVTENYLANLDVVSVRRIRNSNFAFLRDRARCMGLEIVNSAASENGPPFLVISHSSAHEIKLNMARHGVYCPTHWPRPQYLPRDRTWRTDLLSLPVDQRYGLEDMGRLADVLAAVLRRV